VNVGLPLLDVSVARSDSPPSHAHAPRRARSSRPIEADARDADQAFWSRRSAQEQDRDRRHTCSHADGNCSRGFGTKIPSREPCRGPQAAPARTRPQAQDTGQSFGADWTLAVSNPRAATRDFSQPRGLSLARLHTTGWQVSPAAEILGVTTSQIIGLFRKCPAAWVAVNKHRAALGLPALK
jgi:hypothetical protein